MVNFDSSHILQYLAQGAGVMLTIQALKNLLPGIFTKAPKLSQILAAVGALIAALIPCLAGGTGVDTNCVVSAVMTFLSAIGIYHSVAQSGGAVNPPLPPAPKTAP